MLLKVAFSQLKCFLVSVLGLYLTNHDGSYGTLNVDEATAQ